MSDNKRGGVLLDAYEVINGERQDVYGSPEDSFALIANYWNVYLKSRPRDRAYPTGYKDAPLEKADVAMMMVLFKIAREANQHKPDNVCDACGYLGIYEDMESAKDGAE